MNPQTARDEMVLRRSNGNGGNAISQLRAIAGLCNAGEFDAATNDLPLHDRKINGDATDQAILRFSEYLGPVSELLQAWKRTFELSFNSKNKYMIRTFTLSKKPGLELALPITDSALYQFGDT